MSTLEQTQAITSAQVANIPLKPPGVGASAEGTAGEAEAQAQLQPGRGAASDDSASRETQAQQAAIDAEFNSAVAIKPQPNVLDKFSSYTYQASVYLLSPEQYTRLVNSKKKSVNGYQLLFQTGGAASNSGGPQGLAGREVDSTFDAGRNPFFDNDFYIDSITIENAIVGKATSAAHMSSDIKFTVIEPMGITLLDRLYDAVADMAPKNGNGITNYAAAQYLMVIRFFGYDEAGNLVTPGTAPGTTTSNPQSVIEKFIPFLIRRINWSVGTKAVTYEFECAPVGQLVGGSTARGTVPYDVELTNSTVAGVLAGTSSFTPAQQLDADELQRESRGAAKAPPKANAAPTDKKTVTRGLMAAMNEFQRELVRRGIYSIADQYEIVFDDSAREIAEAKIVLSDSRKIDKKGTPQDQAATTNPVGLLPEKQYADMSQRSTTITAGQQIMQVLDTIIRNSSYIYNQSLIVTLPNGTQQPNPNARNKPMKWFLISRQSVPIGNQIDPLRNDYAYKTTYTISAYEVPNFDSKYFPTTQFPGVHKKYNWWFTGQNTSVLDYTATFNTLYNITVSGSTPDTAQSQLLRKKWTSSMREIPRYVYMARSTENSSGAPGKSNEVNANAAEYLYSPGDLHTAKLRIVGDPAWLQQGRSIFDSNNPADSTSGFLPDGTIDFDARQILFEIAWQRPEDYDLSTGLADPYSKTKKKYGNRDPIQSNVYQAVKVVNEFRQGKFEQEINGALYFFPKPDGSNAVTGNANTSAVVSNESARDNQSEAETARLLSKNAPLAATEGRTSVTGTVPTSAYARGVQQALNPPKILANPTLTQLQSSPAYINARRSGVTPQAALDLARQSFAGTAGGSPVTTNGSAAAQSAQPAPQPAGRIAGGTTNTPPQPTNREF